MLMVRPIRALCCHDVHSNCYWITGIGVMDGTHGQYQGAPGVTKLSLVNHTEMWPRAISFSAFLYLKVLIQQEGCNNLFTWPLSSTRLSQSKLWIWSSNGWCMCSLCQSGEETTRENKTRKLPTPASSICIWTHIDCCYTIVVLLDCCLVKFWLQ